MLKLSIGDTITFVINNKRMTGFIVSENENNNTYLAFVGLAGKKIYNIINPNRTTFLTTSRRVVLFEKYKKDLF